MDINLLYGTLAAKAVQDPTFRQLLVEDSRRALLSLDLQLPKGLTLHVVENTPHKKHLVLPQRPDLPLAARWNAPDDSNLYGRLVAQAWSSPKFKDLLVKSPKTALQDLGWDITEDVEIVIL